MEEIFPIVRERELRAERLVQLGYDDMDYPAVDTYDNFMEPGGTPATEDSTTASVASIATKAAKAKKHQSLDQDS